MTYCTWVGTLIPALEVQQSVHYWHYVAGQCAGFPGCAHPAQLADDAHTCASRRACTVAFPTVEAHGLVFVWPDASPGAAQQVLRSSARSVLGGQSLLIP